MAGQSILLIEDDKALSEAAQSKLTKAGYQVTVAPNGEEALLILEDASFDLILLDLLMPRLDGFSVLGKLHTREVNTPIFVLTNMDQQEDINRATDLGADKFLVKATTPLEELIAQIDDYFSNQSEPMGESETNQTPEEQAA